MASAIPDRRRIRILLKQALPTAAELDAFVLDCFPEVYEKFGSGMQRSQKENLLFESEPSGERILAMLKRCSRASAQIRRPLFVAHRPTMPSLTVGILLILALIASVAALWQTQLVKQPVAAIATPDAAVPPTSRSVPAPVPHDEKINSNNIIQNSSHIIFHNNVETH